MNPSESYSDDETETKSLGVLIALSDNSGLKLNVKTSEEGIQETPKTFVASSRSAPEAPSFTASDASPSISSGRFDLNFVNSKPPRRIASITPLGSSMSSSAVFAPPVPSST